MRDIVVKSLGTLAFVCAMLGASARDWYIDANNGNDETGDGTAGFPFATINRASTNSTALAAGDTIWVRPGTYSTGAYVDADGVSNRVYIAKDINLRATDPENGKPFSPKLAKATGYEAEIRYFLSQVEGGKDGDILTAVGARDSVALLCAERRSAATGRTIRV